jgi:16S rRNA (uracil1498-N3)-methyltransferase
MIRLFSAEALAPDQTRFEPDRDDRHHLGVRRAAPDDPVEVLDGRGGVAAGRLVGEPKTAWVALDAVRRVPRPPALALLVGAGDRDRFLWLVEKAQELGATRVVPVTTERVRGVATRVRAEHLTKARRRVVEALKQSGGAWLLELDEPTELDRALAGLDAPVRWLADLAGPTPGPVGGAAVAVLVGPEGGLTPTEREAALTVGFQPVRLAGATLRFETAAIAAAAVITFQRGSPS